MQTSQSFDELIQRGLTSRFEDNLKVLRFRPHYGQAQVLQSDARFKVVGCGRRWGKTVYGTMTIIEAALKDPGPYAWVAPWYKELGPVTTVIDEMVPPSFIKKRSKVIVNGIPIYRYIKLIGGSEISLMSADREDTLRGFKWKGAVVDEAPSIRRERIENELMSSMMDYEGWVLFIGSPKGRNWFHEYYLKGQDRAANPQWESWRQPSYVNTFEKGGYLKRTEIDFIRDQLPSLTQRQEIYAEFLEDEGTVFRKIDASLGGSTGPREPGMTYSVGADLAKTVDWNVFTATDQYGHIRGWERFNSLEWPFIKAKLKSFSLQYPGYTWIDASGVGDVVYDDLVREGLRIMPYKFNTQSKKDLIENLSINFDEGHLTIPPDLLVLRNELKAFTYEITRQRNVIYGAPEGLHDDAVISLALSVWGIRWAKPPIGRLGRVT